MKKSTLVFAVATALLGPASTAFAHQTYNLTGVNVGLTNSINNTDGVSNTGGYGPVGTGSPVRVAGDANANIPGTGGLPTDYTGALPYNLYYGHHDATYTAQTTRQGLTGTSSATTNSLWKAYAAQDASAAWGALVPDIGSSNPFYAVGAQSSVLNSTAGGLDYNLIHASAGTNNNAFNVTTPSAAFGGAYIIDITVNRDAAWNSVNDPNALLDVYLYRGSDTSSTANRTAAFDPSAVGVQGSTLGTGGANGSALLWSASQAATASTLTFQLVIDGAEWAKTDALLGTLNDGLAGYYTLIVGAHGGAADGGVAYTVTTHSYSVPIPAAVWLFGSALGGLGLFGRRKQKSA